MIRVPQLVIFFVLFSSCVLNNPKDILPAKHPNIEHNELITKVHIPEGSKFITGVDTNFIRITVLDLDKVSCKAFFTSNKFGPVNDTFPQFFVGIGYLDTRYQQLPDNNKLVKLSGKNNWTTWVYLLDTTTCRLYGQISFPDLDGYTK